MTSRGNLFDTSEARQRAADAFAAGLRAGDLLVQDEAEEICEFRAYLPEALAKRRLQLNEEPDGWRVVPAPFAFEVVAVGYSALASLAAV